MAIAGAALTAAEARERGGINLGTTSFFDGFGGLEAGCTYIQYIGHYGYSQMNGGDGNKLPSPAGGAGLDITYVAPQLACNSNLKAFGGTLGWNNIVPFSGASSNYFKTNGFGLADTFTGPYIRFPPVMSGGRPIFQHGFEFDIIVPTGKYDAAKTVNPGNDYWSVTPFWRATYLPAPGWEVSWRLYYIHNFDHLSAANVAGPGGATVATNGDGVWLNFAASREILKDFYFGLNGYWLKQLSNDTGTAGAILANTQQEFSDLGPGFHYMIDAKNTVNFNAYLPVTDVNTLSGGYQINLQYIHPLD